MKRLLTLLTVVMLMATAAFADTLTFNWTVEEGVPDHIVFHHKAWTQGQTAQQFIEGTGFTDIEVPATSPATFEISYPPGTEYGIWAELFDAGGNSVVFMDSTYGSLSPTVWKITSMPQIGDAHEVVVTPNTTGDIKITININQSR